MPHRKMFVHKLLLPPRGIEEEEEEEGEKEKLERS